MAREYGFVTEKVTKNKRTGQVVGVSVNEYDYIKGDRYKFARIDSGVLLDVAKPIDSLPVTPAEHSRIMMLLKYLQPNTNELWLVSRRKKHPLTVKSMCSAMSVDPNKVLTERVVKELLNKLTAWGFLGTVETKIIMDNEEEVVQECFCVNPIYAVRGGWVTLDIYHRFRKWMDPYLTENQLRQFREMEARAREEEEANSEDDNLIMYGDYTVDAETGEIMDEEEETESFESLIATISGGRMDKEESDPIATAAAWSCTITPDDQDEEIKTIIDDAVIDIGQKYPDVIRGNMDNMDNLTLLDAARVYITAKALLMNKHVSENEKAATGMATRSLIRFA